jgi:hypothetical protein
LEDEEGSDADVCKDDFAIVGDSDSVSETGDSYCK